MLAQLPSRDHGRAYPVECLTGQARIAPKNKMEAKKIILIERDHIAPRDLSLYQFGHSGVWLRLAPPFSEDDMVKDGHEERCSEWCDPVDPVTFPLIFDHCGPE